MPPPPLISNVLVRLAFLLIFFLVCIDDVRALKNVTVDDQDPSIIYAPAASWAHINDSSTVIFDSSGSHMLTSDPAATATFKFTGVAIYFLSARWPYSVNTAVTLDNGTAVLLDLVDHTRPDAGGGPATVKSQVVAKAVGLKNVTHTLTVSVGQGQIFALVDAVMYTTLAAGETAPNAGSTPPTQLTPVPPSNSTTPTSSSSKSSKSKSKSTKLAIGLSILGVILLILLLIALWFFCRRKDRTQTRRSNYYEDDADLDGQPRRGVSLHDPPVGSSAPRDMRRAYGEDDEGDEKGDDLHVANPDLAPHSPASDTPTMRGPGDAGIGSGGRNAGIVMPAPLAASTAQGLHYGSADNEQQHAQGGQQQQQGRVQSPGRFYGALRDMTHSPARAYPVRDGRLSARDAVPSTASVSVYTDSQGHRSRVYSGVGGGYADEGSGNGMLAPPRAHAQGREAMSGRSSAAVTSELPGEDRWAYPKAPLAYVPVFKA